MAYEISEIKSEVLFSISIVTYCKVFNTSNDSSLCLYSEEVNMTTRVSLILLQILKKYAQYCYVITVITKGQTRSCWKEIMLLICFEAT
jgi:hypothetical protein